LLHGDFSKEDSSGLLRFIGSSLKCNSFSGLEKLIEDLNGLVRCEAATCVLRLDDLKACLRGDIDIKSGPRWLGLYILRGLQSVFSNSSHPSSGDFLADVLKGQGAREGFIDFWGDYFSAGRSWPDNSFSANESAFCVFRKKPECHMRASGILNTAFPHLCGAFFRIYMLQHSKHGETKKNVLSPRERDVLSLLKSGKSSSEIALLLEISERTVKFHVSNVLVKLHAVSRTHAVALAIEHGYIN
jgi:DNA-binding CsgD family transcriptional regulator